MSFDTIHNFYEQMVVRHVQETLGNDSSTSHPDYMADVACVALNHLPPRYIRHDVDMAFYLSPSEREEANHKVKQAVEEAIDFIAHHRKADNQG